MSDFWPILKWFIIILTISMAIRFILVWIFLPLGAKMHWKFFEQKERMNDVLIDYKNGNVWNDYKLGFKNVYNKLKKKYFK